MGITVSIDYLALGSSQVSEEREGQVISEKTKSGRIVQQMRQPEGHTGPWTREWLSEFVCRSQGLSCSVRRTGEN